MNTVYPLIPIATIVLSGYFTTWIFAKWNIITKQTHRLLWNYTLLVTFLAMGILGLIAVIKVNYKLSIPIYDQLLRWHVEFGIIMVIISIFHLSWHLKYYFSSSQLKPKKDNQSDINPQPDWVNSRFLLIVLGIVTIINQVVFTREFISVLDGNEFILGIVMAVWLLITGFGAYWGSKNQTNDLQILSVIKKLVFIAIMPVLQIAQLFWLKSELYPPGTIMGVGISILLVLILLFPVCFLSGFLFTHLATFYSYVRQDNPVGKAYAFESIGSLIAGLVFTFFLGKFFSSITIIGISIGFTTISVAFIVRKSHRRYSSSLIFIGLLIPISILTSKPDQLIKQLFFPNQKIIEDLSTRYGALTITSQSGQLNFYENNVLQFYADNISQCEEAVHFAMCQHQQPKNILLLSGGFTGMLPEIEKYQVEKITWLENNPEIIEHWKYLADSLIAGNNIQFIQKDIRNFLISDNSIYDVILMNLPAPSTLAYNRFYTDEFFKLIKKHCNAQSIICTSLPSTQNYAGQNVLNTNASLWKTIAPYFKSQLLIPGEKNWFLASDAKLSSEITILLQERNIETNYVNKYYFDDNLVQQRAKQLIERFDNQVPINRDFYPYMFSQQVNYWLNYMNTNYKIIIIVPVVAFLILFFAFKPISKGVFIAGFSSFSLEILLMLAYQVYFGSLYFAMALFFSVFMGGISLGSFLSFNKQNFSRKNLAYSLFLLALLTLLIPLFNLIIGKLSSHLIVVQILFFIPIILVAFLTGRIFNLASNFKNTKFRHTAALNYSTDLLGSALGAILIGLFLIPLFGIVLTCIVISAFNLLCFLSLYFKTNN